MNSERISVSKSSYKRGSCTCQPAEKYHYVRPAGMNKNQSSAVMTHADAVPFTIVHFYHTCLSYSLFVVCCLFTFTCNFCRDCNHI